MSNPSTGTVWFLPIQKVLQPVSRRTRVPNSSAAEQWVLRRTTRRHRSDESKPGGREVAGQCLPGFSSTPA
jgi:hypothetical protein